MGIIFTPSVALNTNDTNINVSFRNVVALLAGGSSVRATFNASGATALTSAHCAIGVLANGGSAWETVGTPTELLFGGASGFAIGAGQSITSDFASLVFSASNKLVVIIDVTTPGGQLFSTGNTNCDCYFGGGGSYNLSNPAFGGGTLLTKDYTVSSVEAAAVVGGAVITAPARRVFFKR